MFVRPCEVVANSVLINIVIKSHYIQRYNVAPRHMCNNSGAYRNVCMYISVRLPFPQYSLFTCSHCSSHFPSSSYSPCSPSFTHSYCPTCSHSSHDIATLFSLFHSFYWFSLFHLFSLLHLCYILVLTVPPYNSFFLFHLFNNLTVLIDLPFSLFHQFSLIHLFSLFHPYSLFHQVSLFFVFSCSPCANSSPLFSVISTTSPWHQISACSSCSHSSLCSSVFPFSLSKSYKFSLYIAISSLFLQLVRKLRVLSVYTHPVIPILSAFLTSNVICCALLW